MVTPRPSIARKRHAAPAGPRSAGVDDPGRIGGADRIDARHLRRALERARWQRASSGAEKPVITRA